VGKRKLKKEMLSFVSEYMFGKLKTPLRYQGALRKPKEDAPNGTFMIRLKKHKTVTKNMEEP
jgi:hypothetical protein